MILQIILLRFILATEISAFSAFLQNFTSGVAGIQPRGEKWMMEQNLYVEKASHGHGFVWSINQVLKLRPN